MLEQRELQRLRDLGATHVHVAAIVTLRIRANRNGEVRDGIASLARWSCMSEWSMRRALRWLIDQHIVVALDRERSAGKSQGAAWRWPRRVSPFEFWPSSPLPEQETLPMWRLEQRAPRFDELVRFKAAGGRI